MGYRLDCGRFGQHAATGQHEFDTPFSTLGIEHRLTPPRSLQTNRMVERFNSRIEEVLRSHRFRSGEKLGTMLIRYVWIYKKDLCITTDFPIDQKFV